MFARCYHKWFSDLSRTKLPFTIMAFVKNILYNLTIWIIFINVTYASTFKGTGRPGPLNKPFELDQANESRARIIDIGLPDVNQFLSFPCGGTFELAPGQVQQILSPNYPDPHYSWARCRWHFETMSMFPNAILKFSCSDFGLAPSSLCNAYSDFLLVESQGGGARWYCGSDQPDVLEAPSFIITFWSNSDDNFRGFDCKVEAISDLELSFPTALPQPPIEVAAPQVQAEPPSYNSNCRCGRSAPLKSHDPVTNARRKKFTQMNKTASFFDSRRRPLPRIISGQPAKINEFPWLVALEYPIGVRCGGSIINDLYVLTAAHCLTNLKLIAVLAGEYSLEMTDETPYTRRLAVEFTLLHEDYDSETFDNDVALIRLAERIDFSIEYPYIAPACPPKLSSYVGWKATVAGWGFLDESGSFPTDVVNKAETTIIDEETCRKKLEQVVNNPVTDNMVCAGGDGLDACTNDSGGPLMVKEGQHWLLIGVVSWGFGCARKNIPGIYMKVSRYMKWIEKNTYGARSCSA